MVNLDRQIGRTETDPDIVSDGSGRRIEKDSGLFRIERGAGIMRRVIALMLAVLIAVSNVAFAAAGADRETVKQVQKVLNDEGYPCGAADGVAGKKTAAAIRQYQQDHGLEVTGTIDDALLAAMGMLPADEPEPEPEPEPETESAEVSEVVTEELVIAEPVQSEPPAETAAEPEKTMGELSVGENISFGHYEQDDDESNGPESIEWIVLDVQDGLATLISRYGLDAMPYNEELGSATWANCSLRRWLNEDFLGTAFDAEEQLMLQTRSVPAGKNTVYNTNPGSGTQDKVYILSMQEVERYFPYDEARICTITVRARANGAWKTRSGVCFWWLRSPGNNEIYAAQVNLYGEIKADGSLVSSTSAVFRPVITVKCGKSDGESFLPVNADASPITAENAMEVLNSLYTRARQISGSPWDAQNMSGKLAIAIYRSVDSDNPEILTSSSETDYPFPTESLSVSLEEAEILAIVFPTHKTVGSYTSGGEAKDTTTWVAFFDLRKGVQYEAIPVKTNQPPQTITVTVIGSMTTPGSGYGEYEIQPALDFIRDSVLSPD